MSVSPHRPRVIPPVYFLGAILMMTGLHFFVPTRTIVVAPYNYLGVLIIVVGVGMAAWGARTFKRVGTPIKPFEPSSELVTHGPYRYTRNPMYLGMVSVLCGVAVLLGSGLPVVVVPAFVWFIQHNFIRLEEADLERTFGSRFVEYRKNVRRWL